MKKILLSIMFVMSLLLTSINPSFANEKIGNASWYGGQFHGKKMANGQVFNENRLTVAHKTLPFGTKLEITCTKTGKSVQAVVKDRGPYVHGRVLDLSKEAARQLGMLERGVTQVKYKIIE